MKLDAIARPSHYCEGRKYEPKDVIRDWNLNFNLGNVVKYVSRCGRKIGETEIKDLKKARQYLDFEINALENENQNGSQKDFLDALSDENLQNSLDWTKLRPLETDYANSKQKRNNI